MSPAAHVAAKNDALGPHWNLDKPWPMYGPVADRELLADVACTTGQLELLTVAKSGTDAEATATAASLRLALRRREFRTEAETDERA